jgi:hypothetical protein
MPTIRRNHAYNATQPGVAQGMDNIAKMFAPPAATDMLAYAKAGEIAKQNTGRAALRSNGLGTIADFYDAGAANAPQAAMQAELYRRATAIPTGGDMSVLDPILFAEKGGYGTNTVAGTREAQTAQTQRTGIEQQGALTRAIVAPLSKDQLRVLPPSIAGMYDVPQQQTGVLEAPMGNNIYVPAAGGAPERVVSGPAKPLDRSQMEAAILGQMEPDRQQEVVYGSPTLTPVGPKGVMQPALRAVGKTETPEDPDYKGSQTGIITDGKGQPVGTAILHPDTGQWVQSQDKTPLPQGTNVIPMSVAAAKTGDLGGGVVSQSEQRLQDIDIADAHIGRLTDLLAKNPGAQGLLGNLRGTFQNVIQTGGELGTLLDGANKSLLQDAARGALPAGMAEKLGYDASKNSFDPAIPAVEIARNAVINSYAKAVGNDSRQSEAAYRRAEKALGAEGLLSNGPQTTASLAEMRNELAAARGVYAKASGPGVNTFGATSPSGAAPAPTAPAGPPPPLGAPAGTVQVKTPEEAAALAPGTRFVTPDGRVKVRP